MTQCTELYQLWIKIFDSIIDCIIEWYAVTFWLGLLKLSTIFTTERQHSTILHAKYLQTYKLQYEPFWTVANWDNIEALKP